MHGIAAAAGLVKPLGEIGDMARQFGRRDALLGESEAEQQRIDAPFFREQRANFLRAVPIEQEIGIGAEQVDVADAERQRRLEMPLGRREIAETGCGLGQHRQRPEAYLAALLRRPRSSTCRKSS